MSTKMKAPRDIAAIVPGARVSECLVSGLAVVVLGFDGVYSGTIRVWLEIS